MGGNVEEVLVGTRAGKLAGRRRERRGRVPGRPVRPRPPVGTAFRPPQPVEPWADVRDATRFGPVAPQLPSAMEMMLGQPEIVSDEDCLSLNVWTPGLDGRRRPVLFWIHGGAFIFGAGATPWYDGTTVRARTATSWSSRSTTGSARSASCTSTSSSAPTFAGSGNVGHPRPGRRARVGARQHRGVRRRPRPRARSSASRPARERRHAARHARAPTACSTGRSCRAARRRSRLHPPTRPKVAERADRRKAGVTTVAELVARRRPTRSSRAQRQLHRGAARRRTPVPARRRRHRAPRRPARRDRGRRDRRRPDCSSAPTSTR